MPKLRPCELRVVRLLVEGHSVTSAAAVLGIRYQVAKQHLNRAHDRTAMNTYELVSRVAVADFAGVQQ